MSRVVHLDDFRRRREFDASPAARLDRELERDARAVRLAQLRLPMSADIAAHIARGSLHVTPCVRVVRDWSASAVGVLVLCAPHEAGKTVAAAELLATEGRHFDARTLERQFNRSGQLPATALDARLIVVDALDRAQSFDGTAMLGAILARRPRGRTLVLGALDAEGWEAFADAKVSALVAMRGRVVVLDALAQREGA